MSVCERERGEGCVGGGGGSEVGGGGENSCIIEGKMSQKY